MTMDMNLPTEAEYLAEIETCEGENEQFTLPDGSKVGTGLLRDPEGPKVRFAAFPDDLMLEDADIKRLLEKRSIKASRARRKKQMQNQGQIGSCAARAAVGAFYQVQELAGHPHTPLQPEHLYANCNGGRDSGAVTERVMQTMVAKGCGPAGCVPYQSYNRRQQSGAAAADQAGLNFRLHEPYALPETFREYCRALASAGARGYPIAIVWHVGNGSMRLDGRGFCQVGRGVGNHATFIHELEWIGGEDLVHGDNQNSWGPTLDEIYGRTSGGWGEDGFGRITMEDLFATRRHHTHYVPTSLVWNKGNESIL